MSTLDELRAAYEWSCTNPAYSNANTWPEIEAAAALIAALEAENERLRAAFTQPEAIRYEMLQQAVEQIDELRSLLTEIEVAGTEGHVYMTPNLWDRIHQDQEPTP